MQVTQFDAGNVTQQTSHSCELRMFFLLVLKRRQHRLVTILVIWSFCKKKKCPRSYSLHFVNLFPTVLEPRKSRVKVLVHALLMKYFFSRIIDGYSVVVSSPWQRNKPSFLLSTSSWLNYLLSWLALIINLTEPRVIRREISLACWYIYGELSSLLIDLESPAHG